MDPSDGIIIQRANPEKKPRLDAAQTQGHYPTRVSAAVSNVFDTNDLLMEILLRVGFPTTLVRAAAVCRRWLHQASDQDFLCRFRELHPPHLLGLYVNPGARWKFPRFVPILPQPPELAVVIRRASSSLDIFQSDIVWTYIKVCRNNNILIEHREEGRGSTFGVHNPLCPQRDMVIVPQFPGPRPHDDNICIFQKILSKEEECGDLSYLYVLMHSTADRKNVAQVYILRDGVWYMHLTIDQIPRLRFESEIMLADNKIYMPAERDIVVLDYTASSFATIQLPHGVKFGMRNTMLSRADTAANVYLVHVKKLQLCVWLHNVNEWLLVDSICLREMCGSLIMLHRNAIVRLKHVGDNAEFVFLEMGPCTLFWDVKRRIVHKVHEMTKEDRWLSCIFPFMMIWPPKFPMLKDPEKFSS